MLVFLDASVLVAAAFSPAGGSFRIIQEAAVRGFEPITSRYAYQEAERNILEKHPQQLPAFRRIAALLTLVPDPPKRLVADAMKVIDFKDAPVLAGAIKARAKILITLDRKHFIENTKIGKAYPTLSVLTPREFIQNRFT